MLFFGRIPCGLTHILTQLIAAAGVGCFGGNRRAAIVTARAAAKPLRPLAPHKATAFQTSPFWFVPSPFGGLPASTPAA